jgi:hypothetical protein
VLALVEVEETCPLLPEGEVVVVKPLLPKYLIKVFWQHLLHTPLVQRVPVPLRITLQARTGATPF